jgi:hypothetical protein
MSGTASDEDASIAEFYDSAFALRNTFRFEAEHLPSCWRRAQLCLPCRERRLRLTVRYLRRPSVIDAYFPAMVQSNDGSRLA